MIRTILVGVIFIFGSLFTACVHRPQPSLEIGSPAPAFSLPDLDGRNISLDQYRGKVVLLDFWATWCGPCRMTMPLMEQLQKEFADALTLFAVNLGESPESVREFLREQNLNPRVLLDKDQRVGELYGAGAIPMHVLIDKSGIVREILIGFDPRMLPQLRSKIRNLQNGTPTI